MPYNIQVFQTEILQSYFLKVHEMKVEDIARQIRQNNAGIYQILSIGGNFGTKSQSGKSRKTTKHQDRDFQISFNPELVLHGHFLEK